MAHPFRKLTLPCGQGGLQTRPYVHKLIPLYPAHPELVEGRDRWFDKLTMSGLGPWRRLVPARPAATANPVGA